MRFVLPVAVIAALLTAACAPLRLPAAAGGQSSTSSSRWACAALPASSGAPSLYAMQSVWPQVQPKLGNVWGDEPAERGPTRLLRLDPATGATLAADAGPGVGFAAGPHGDLIARLAFRFPDPTDPTALPQFAGIELLAVSFYAR